MPCGTSVERIAKADGRTEGGAAVLLKLLGKRWGLLPEQVQQQIRCLTFEQLAALGEALLDFTSPHDIQAWLDAQSHTPQ